MVAMLTPGPADPHWPEHLALSRDLACALVEARDLTVRGGVLSIKTLDGLQSRWTCWCAGWRGGRSIRWSLL